MRVIEKIKYSLVFTLPILICITFIVHMDAFARPALEKAPEFALNDLNGKRVMLSEFEGKPVLLNFWATWCGYCRRERPHLNDLYDEYKKQGLVIVSISTDRSIEKLRNYLKRVPADYIVLSDSGGRTAEKYRIRGYPSSFLIDRNGVVQRAFTGYRNWTDASSLKMINALIKGD